MISSSDSSGFVFLVFLIPNADDFGRNLLVFTNHDIHGKKVLAAAAALLADAKIFLMESCFPSYS